LCSYLNVTLSMCNTSCVIFRLRCASKPSALTCRPILAYAAVSGNASATGMAVSTASLVNERDFSSFIIAEGNGYGCFGLDDQVAQYSIIEFERVLKFIQCRLVALDIHQYIMGFVDLLDWTTPVAGDP